MDKPLEFQHLSPVGTQANIGVPQQGRKPKRKVQEPQQQMSDVGKDTVPLRPLRRTDSLTPDWKQKCEDLSVKLLLVDSSRKYVSGEVIPTQPAIFPPCNINKGEGGISLGEPQKEQVQENVGTQVSPYTGEHRQKEEAESVQTSVDVVPPPRLKRRDGTLPPETPQTTCKPLGGKAETDFSKTNDQHNVKVQVSSTLKGSYPVPSKPGEKSSDVSGVFECLQTFDNICQAATKIIPLQPVGEKKQTTTNFIQNASSQEELVFSKGTEHRSCTWELLKKDNETSVHTSCHVINPSETERAENNAPRTEIFQADQTSSLSIIKRIRLPHGKTRLSSKSAKTNFDKEIIAQNLNVAKMECIKPVQIINTVMNDMEEIKQSKVVGDTAVDATNVTSLRKSVEASGIAQAENKVQTKICIPKPRMRKRISSCFLEDVTAMESTASHGDEAQGARAAGPLIISSTTKTLVKAQDSKGRSRYDIESSVQVDDGGISEKTPGALSMPVPKPRGKKRLSGSFPDDVTISGSPTIDNESVQQDGQSSLPVPMPRAKKRLSVTYSGSGQPAEGLFPLEYDFSQKHPEDMYFTNNKTKEDSTTLDSSEISEGGFVTIPREDDASLELVREFIPAMADEEFRHVDSVEDTEKALDEISEGWTFPDKPAVTDDLEKDEISEQAETEKAQDAEVDRSVASTVASSHDDWLHVENDKDNEVNRRKEMRDEELDFGFVSVDVAAGSLIEER